MESFDAIQIAGTNPGFHQRWGISLLDLARRLNKLISIKVASLDQAFSQMEQLESIDAMKSRRRISRLPRVFSKVLIPRASFEQIPEIQEIGLHSSFPSALMTRRVAFMQALQIRQGFPEMPIYEIFLNLLLFLIKQF